MDIFRPLKSCSWCGRIGIVHNLYCEHCLGRLESLREWREINGLPFKVYSLFSLQEKRVLHFILRLKGGKNALVFNDLSFFIWEAMNSQVCKKPVFIPAPPRSVEDHATLFAKSLSAVWGGSPYWNGLCRESGVSQKRLKQSERKKLRMDRYLPLPPKTSTHIFVDDVVTTGSTALAAYKTLGKPHSFHLWSLANMPLMGH